MLPGPAPRGRGVRRRRPGLRRRGGLGGRAHLARRKPGGAGRAQGRRSRRRRQSPRRAPARTSLWPRRPASAPTPPDGGAPGARAVEGAWTPGRPRSSERAVGAVMPDAEECMSCLGGGSKYTESTKHCSAL
ncbi:Polycystin-2 [Manis pentadactyla]|nr:Polycystin-2 [Manis pentadactyla]